ncbi:MAG TPA: PEGA domain-containing protein [Terriglobia bacterium]|nr:PEGA domain-containing protein [Terriglobia bacterium]
MKPFSTQPAKWGSGTRAARSLPFRWWREVLLLALLICLGTVCALAQAAVQPSQAPAVTSDDGEEAANRKALEDQAGKNAAKLMLRSVPDKSSVRIDGKPVGKTPLLLILRPGVYVVEMEGGPRKAYGRRQADLLPKEAREVVLELKPRYPTSVLLPSASR